MCINTEKQKTKTKQNKNSVFHLKKKSAKEQLYRDPHKNDQCSNVKRPRFLMFIFVEIEELLRNSDCIAPLFVISLTKGNPLALMILDFTSLSSSTCSAPRPRLH